MSHCAAAQFFGIDPKLLGVEAPKTIGPSSASCHSTLQNASEESKPMSNHIFTRLHSLLLILVVGMIASSSAFGNVTITIQNADTGPTGFNDPTPATPVGGNNGTTIGQQRLNAFQFAASIWGATLNSSQPIVISAGWAAQSCTANSGVLGSAGSAGISKDFPNAPFPNTWYSRSLANALSNSDLNGATPGDKRDIQPQRGDYWMPLK